MFRSDVALYWKDSIEWANPYNPYHVPGYPLLIAFMRMLTLGLFPPLFIMIVIAFVSYLGSSVIVYRLAETSTGDARLSQLLTMLFGFWPFVGITYSVYPVADSLVIFLFVSGVYSFLQSHELLAGILFGGAMIVHKAIWPFMFMVIVAQWVMTRRRPSWSFVLPLVLPLTLLWLLGAHYHGSMGWLFTSNVKAEIASKGMIPVLDGIIGPIMAGGLAGFLKSTIVICVAIGCALLITTGRRSKTKEKPLAIAICVSVLLLCLILNRSEIWASVRFSRLLVLPILWSGLAIPSWIYARKGLIPILLLILFISQLTYAWYMARIFFH